jgi:hypothetical protein
MNGSQSQRRRVIAAERTEIDFTSRLQREGFVDPVGALNEVGDSTLAGGGEIAGLVGSIDGLTTAGVEVGTKTLATCRAIETVTTCSVQCWRLPMRAVA